MQTFVNGEKRQDSTTKDLIFSIPFLVHTLSEGITIQPGDVIATGTVSHTVNAFRIPTDIQSLLVLGSAKIHQCGSKVAML